MIKAISFDADGTLWDFDRVMRESLGHALAELRRLCPEEAALLTIDGMIAIRDEVEARLWGQARNLEAVRLAAFQETLRRIGAPDDDLAAHLNAMYLRHRFEGMAASLYDDVFPTLAALQGRYTLGLLTNGNSYPERCGLAGKFQFAVYGQDYGVKKPDPKLFEAALGQAGCAPRELLHVGDSLANDVGGARRTGVWSVWLNRRQERHGTEVWPDFEIATLGQLVGICRSLV